MSLALANELAALNVRVNTVNPVGVATGMAPASLHGLLSQKRPDLVGIYENALPVSLVEGPRDASNAVLFLVSDESRYVTGLEFKVDAGATIR
jgi:NAD(P)-dependent dehydrogenase (short-subunit alcohol dehydrogenase family)